MNSESRMLDMARLYLTDNPEPTFESMIAWQPKPDPVFKYTRDDWVEMLEDPRLFSTLAEAGNCSIKNYPLTDFKELGTKTTDKPLAISGRVIALSDREPDEHSIIYYCRECGIENDPDSNGRQPKKCIKCDKTKFDPQLDKSKLIDSQIIRLYDSQISISCVARGDRFMYRVKPGKKALGFGTLRFDIYTDEKTHKPRFRRYFDLAHIEPLENTDVKLTAEDIERLKKLPDEPQFYEKLRDSFAPHLYGIEEVKEACLLALASQGLERPLNIGLFGDPDTGKSEAMFYAVELSHNGHKTDMASATHVGLTVESAYDEETKKRLAYAGMLNYADGGLAGIDELQAIHEDSAKKLNGVLESKEINADKAGVHERLPARCAIIVTSNSEFGHWDQGRNIYENLKFLGKSRAAIVSRFDLIYILRDIKHDDTDAKKADKIAKTYGKTEKASTLFMDDTADYFGFLTMKKYFAYIVTLPLPEVPDSLIDELKDIYLDAREKDNENMVGNRYFKSIIRLARILARLLQKPAVTAEDVNRAKDLIDKSRNAAAFDPKLNEVDANLITGLKGKGDLTREKNQEETFWECYEKACKSAEGVDRGYFEIHDIKFYLVQKGWSETKTERYIERLERSGRIYSPHGQGRYTKI